MKLWVPKEPATQAERVCKLLNSRNRKEREWAEHWLRRLYPDSMPEMLEALAQERINRKRQRILKLIVVALLLLVMIRFHMYGNLIQLIGLISAAFAATQAQKTVALTLTQLEDVRTVGALAEALEYKDKQIARAAELALVRLLPRLKASDAGVLDAEQRAALYRALNRESPELVVAILRALEQVGDSQALPAVQRLADGKGWVAGDLRIRPLARELLPVLARRSEEERSRQTLLRAASATGNVATPSEMLLRPASGIAVTDPQELLRTVSNGSEVPVADIVAPFGFP